MPRPGSDQGEAMPQDSAFQSKHRRIAATCAKRMAQQNWPDRRRTIETTLHAVRRDMGSFAAGAMVASVLRQLDISTVVDNDQALIFAMSECADHQVAACDWFIGQSLNMRAATAWQSDADGVRGATIH